MAKAIQPAEMWHSLNERQRHYLHAVYEIDQEKEAHEKYIRASGDYNRPPASEWRWINYTPLTTSTQLYDRIGHTHIDPGTGSTFEALETRGLIESRYEAGAAYDSNLLFVKITPLGRKVVRAALAPEEQPKRQPKGVLGKWSWYALKLAYEAGDAGVPRTDVGFYGGISWKIWVRLRNRKPALVEEYVKRMETNIYGLMRSAETVIRLTAAGRQFYDTNLEKHQATYPELYRKPEQDQ